MSLTYLCTLPLPDSWFAALGERLPDLDVHRVEPGTEPATDVLARADLVHTSTWIPDPAAAPALRCVQLDTSGADHLRDTALWDSGVPIATLGGIAPVPMAEYAMMAVLELAHQMPRIQLHRAGRDWPSDADRLANLTPRLLPGATLGIIGYGRIGREVSRLAKAFGMHVVGVSRTGAERAAVPQFDAGRLRADGDETEILPVDRLDEAMRRSDVLVVVVPLTEHTRGLVSGAMLDELPRGALVVNIARGGIVDEQALLDRLRDGRIGGVALDVFDDEPLPADAAWWSEPNVLVTPHVAGLAPRYLDDTLALVVENLTRLANGQQIMNEVDRDSGY